MTTRLMTGCWCPNCTSAMEVSRSAQRLGMRCNCAKRELLPTLRYKRTLRCEQGFPRGLPVQCLSSASGADCRHGLSGHQAPTGLWFVATYLVSQTKTGRSALAVKKQLGASYSTDWPSHQDLVQSMVQRDGLDVLERQAQVDDAYQPSQPTGMKARRGSENTLPLATAVPVSEEGHTLHAKLAPFPGLTLEAIAPSARNDLAPGFSGLSGGLACFNFAVDAGCVYQPTVVGGRKRETSPEFASINTSRHRVNTVPSSCYNALASRNSVTRYVDAFRLPL